MRTVLTLNPNRTWSVSAEPGEALEIAVMVGGIAELTFPMQVDQALGLGMALMQLASAPAPMLVPVGTTVIPDLPPAPPDPALDKMPADPAAATTPVLPEMRKAKKHTHRHCEVCNEPICRIVQARETRENGGIAPIQ